MPTLTYNQKNKNPPPPPQLQNTSNESEKSASPIVPPRPTRHVLNNTQQQPNKTSRAPPPPPSMPTELPNLSIPIAPPLPPPAPPIFLIEQTPNPTLTVPANTEHNSLLKEICNFNTVKLKVCVVILVYLLT